MRNSLCFREFWVEKPTPASDALTMYALLDSASVTGAFRFTIRSLDTTIIDTEMTLIARVATDKLGIGAMAAAYLFSPLDHRRPDDWRAAVYEVAGLQIQSGKGEWLWRPVSNRETLQISAFADVNPRGFGLLQRTRAFDAFYDDEGRWELRPTLWIEPIGDWGDGDLRLLEIPCGIGKQRQYHRAVAAEGRTGGQHYPVVRLSPVLVLVAAFAPAAGNLRVEPQRQKWLLPALYGGDGRRRFR